MAMATTAARDIPPGMLRRLACMGYELIMLTAVLLLGVLLPHAIFGAIFHFAASATALWGHIVALLLVYFGWFWTHGGQTLPMKTWRIRLVSVDSVTVRPAQALLRYLLSWPSLLFFGIGILWAFLDRDRQFLHDRLAGTRLIVAI